MLRPRSRPRFAATTFMAIVCTTTLAAAEDPDLQEARAAREDLRYDDALAKVRPILDDPHATRRAGALEIAATMLLLEGKKTEGQAMLHALYDLAPAFELTDSSLPPRVTESFAREAQLPHARAVAMTIRAKATKLADYTLQTSADAGQIALSCAAATGSTGAEGVATAAPIEVKAAGPRIYAFHLPTIGMYKCYAIASDADGLPLGRLGSVSVPVTLEPPAPVAITQASNRAVTSKWWFWTSVGVAVAGGAVATYALTRPKDVSAPAADLTVSPHSSTTSFAFR